MRTHTYLQHTSEMRTHTHPRDSNDDTDKFQQNQLGSAQNVLVHFEGKNVAVQFSKLPILLDLDECKMHVQVPLNAFIVVFVRALDKQTPLSW